jgi:hypothetical protein
MNDDTLGNAWTTLEPTSDRRRRIEARVSAWLEARDTPLTAEWLALFSLAPLTALGLATVSTVAIVLAPPVVWVAVALL